MGRYVAWRAALVVIVLAIFIFPTVQGRAAPAPRKRVVVGQGELLTSFDYPYDWNIAATWIQSNIGDCMVWKDRKTSKFAPWLAERWENTGPRTWRFFLRRGVRFTNGEPFNAEAVKFSIDRILNDEKTLVHNQYKFVERVAVVDEYTVDVHTVNTEPAFLSKISQTACMVVPPRYVQQVGPAGFARKPIGTGAYKLVEEVKDSRIVLEANENYFQGKPDIDEIVFRAIPEVSTRVNELLTGGVDLVVDVPPQDWQRINRNASTRVLIADSPTTQLLVVRITDDKGTRYVTSHRLVRAAIEHAIDKNTLVKLIQGMGIPTRTRITPPTFASDENLYGAKNGDIYNPARAKALLAEAGYKGEPIEFVTSTGRWFMSKEIAEAITAMLQQVGLNIQLKVLDVTTFNEQYYFPAYRGIPANKGLMMEALRNSFFDPWIAVLEAHCRLGPRRSGYCKPEVDKLIEAAATNMNVAEREKQYKRIQKYLADDRPLIFLYHMKAVYGMNKRLLWEPAPDTFLWLGNAKVSP
jgi:peptide/nickel transport system substrate-binding protein